MATGLLNSDKEMREECPVLLPWGGRLVGGKKGGNPALLPASEMALCLAQHQIMPSCLHQSPGCGWVESE